MSFSYNDPEKVTPTDEAIQYHYKLAAMLVKKLALVPKHTFYAECKPTIDDIYKLTKSCYPNQIPRSVGLFYLFQNFGYLASNNFSGCKLEGGFNVSRMVWYWNLDKTHSFSRHHHQVLANFLVASLVAAEGENYDAKGMFVQLFIEAFITANLRDTDHEEQDEFLNHWDTCEFDLITFTNKDLKRIMKKVLQLREELPSEPMQTTCFASEARRQNYALYCQNAAAWAVHWMAAWEKKAEAAEADEKEDQTKPLKWDDDLCDVMAALGMNNDVSCARWCYGISSTSRSFRRT
ncbi:uncharacterized protein N0V89_009079 [Didymosphaeria variabile]|uniref:Uncharacterized protein n=1 Tax=Didymosphaeria variabile TaxID=1932322 RepID=A0A9W8XHN1_9PLEO|nr:uncharacterized protein N0V89_009079 [Didymosphaeria variabile]KAJ4350458.1 hypothetical protein N0V89_009079 [Didymosphaeria variabile]